MPTKEELKELAKLRLKEAETLFDAELYDGAVYLCGYAVEFALKARICQLLEVNEYPSYGRLKTAYAVHDLSQLLLLSGLKNKMSAGDIKLRTNWFLITPDSSSPDQKMIWTPEIRYQPKDFILKKGNYSAVSLEINFKAKS